MTADQATEGTHQEVMMMLIGLGGVFMIAANGVMLAWILDELAVEVPHMGDVLTIYTIGVIAVVLGVLYPTLRYAVSKVF